MQQLDRAIVLDPSFAAAHLRRALLSYEQVRPEIREHLQAARTARASLGERDLLILDAIEPWALAPPDLRESQRRFESAVEKFPHDAELAFDLGWTPWRRRATAMWLEPPRAMCVGGLRGWRMISPSICPARNGAGPGEPHRRWTSRLCGRNSSYPCYPFQMRSKSTRAEKISVSVAPDTLKRAKLLAKRNGVTLSRLFTEALDLLTAEEERRAAAREIVATFPSAARATNAEKEALRKRWSTPHEVVAKKRRVAG